MDDLREQFQTARRDMLDAFADLSTLAHEAGVGFDVMTDLHGRFFEGNLLIKNAFDTIEFIADFGMSSGGGPTTG